MQFFFKTKPSIEETIKSIRKFLYDLICKYSEFEEIIEYLSINNIFFWLEFITGLPSRSLQEERTFYTLEFK